MNRRLESRFARPALEVLEARDLPSFLFPGTATASLSQPLNSLNQDLQNHKTDLLSIVNTTLQPNNTTFPPGNAGASFAKAVGDYQAMLNDQHAIDALSKADLAFLHAAASAELASGDPVDFIVLNFGPLIGLNVQSQFTTPATNADNAVNDPTVKSDVGISWTYLTPVTNTSYTLGSIASQTASNHDTQSSQGDLNITNTAHTLIIQGTTDASGNPTSIIDQMVADRVFQIVNPGTTVLFKNIVIEGGDASGGGVYFARKAGGQLTNDTVVGNQAKLSGTLGVAEGGGLDNNNGDTNDVTLTNTIVAGNSVLTSAGSPQSPDVRGQLVSAGHNLIGIADGVNDPSFTLPGDQAGSLASPLNPLLGSLQNNGGLTPTMLPLPGSPVLGAGDPSLAPGTDQRGQPRPPGGPTDLGSVQVSTPPTAPPPSPAPSSVPSPSLFQAILGIYIDEVEKDLHLGNQTALEQNMNFLSQYTVILGIDIAPLIEGLADANVAAALDGNHS